GGPTKVTDVCRSERLDDDLSRQARQAQGSRSTLDHRAWGAYSPKPLEFPEASLNTSQYRATNMTSNAGSVGHQAARPALCCVYLKHASHSVGLEPLSRPGSSLGAGLSTWGGAWARSSGFEIGASSKGSLEPGGDLSALSVPIP